MIYYILCEHNGRDVYLVYNLIKYSVQLYTICGIIYIYLMIILYCSVSMNAQHFPVKFQVNAVCLCHTNTHINYM